MKKIDIAPREGWIEHNGGPCPVLPGTDVWVRLRNGQLVHIDANRIRWTSAAAAEGQHRDDIVAYVVTEEGHGKRSIADLVSLARMAALELHETHTLPIKAGDLELGAHSLAGLIDELADALEAQP